MDNETLEGSQRLPIEIGNSGIIPVRVLDESDNVTAEYGQDYSASVEKGQSFIYGCNDADEEEKWLDVTDPVVQNFYKMEVKDGDGNVVGYTYPGNVMIKAMTADTDTILTTDSAEVTLTAYDANGTVLKTAALTEDLVLPLGTASIALNGNDTAELNIGIGDKAFKAGDAINVDYVKASPMKVYLTGTERGDEVTNSYTFNLGFETSPEEPTDPDPTPGTDPENKPDSTNPDSTHNTGSPSGNTNTGIHAENTAFAAAAILATAALGGIVLYRKRRNTPSSK